MRGSFGRFVVYCKVSFVGLLFLAIVVLVWQNRGYKTNFWPGAADAQSPVATLWLILLTSVLSIVVFWVLTKTRRVLRELAEVRAQRAEAQKLATQEQRRKELEEQERRIDAKIKQAIGEGPPSPPKP